MVGALRSNPNARWPAGCGIQIRADVRLLWLDQYFQMRRRASMAMQLCDELQRWQPDGKTWFFRDATERAAGGLGSSTQSGLFGFARGVAASSAVGAVRQHEPLPHAPRRPHERDVLRRPCHFAQAVG